jgi:hypothetical protein
MEMKNVNKLNELAHIRYRGGVNVFRKMTLIDCANSFNLLTFFISIIATTIIYTINNLQLNYIPSHYESNNA